MGHHDDRRPVVDRRLRRHLARLPDVDERRGLREPVVRQEELAVVDDDRPPPDRGRRCHERHRVVAGAAHDQPQRRLQHLDEHPGAAGERPDLASGRQRAGRGAAASPPRSPPSSPSDPCDRPVGRHDEPRAGQRRRHRSDSTTVTRQIGCSRSSAIRSAPATSAARSAGSMKTSIAPLHPSPRPHTSSSSAVRSQPREPRAAFLHHDLRHVGDVALEAPAADVADRRALLGDQEPGAGAPVRRPADRHDRGERHPFAASGQRLDGLEDVRDLAHGAMLGQVPRDRAARSSAGRVRAVPGRVRERGSATVALLAVALILLFAGSLYVLAVAPRPERARPIREAKPTPVERTVEEMDAAAQTGARSASAAALTAYADLGSFDEVTPPLLAMIEPSLSYTRSESEEEGEAERRGAGPELRRRRSARGPGRAGGSASTDVTARPSWGPARRARPRPPRRAPTGPSGSRLRPPARLPIPRPGWKTASGSSLP